MSELAGFPAWYWQVFGVLCGLGLGVLIGAIRMRRRAPETTDLPISTPPASMRQSPGNGAGAGVSSPGLSGHNRAVAPADTERLPRVMVPPAPAPGKSSTSGTARTAGAEASAGNSARRSKSTPAAGGGAAGSGNGRGAHVGGSGEAASPQPSTGLPANASRSTAAAAGPAASSGGAPAVASIPPAAPPTRQTANVRQSPPPQAPVANLEAAAPATPAAPDAVAVLQEYTTELLEQLRSNQNNHLQELQTRSQQAQEERRRHETLLESLRQEHSAELSRLMGTMTEQVDLLHQQYGQRIKQLESDLERLRLLGNSTVSPAELPTDTVRPAAVVTAPPTAPSSAS